MKIIFTLTMFLISSAGFGAATTKDSMNSRFLANKATGIDNFLHREEQQELQEEAREAAKTAAKIARQAADAAVTAAYYAHSTYVTMCDSLCLLGPRYPQLVGTVSYDDFFTDGFLAPVQRRGIPRIESPLEEEEEEEVLQTLEAREQTIKPQSFSENAHKRKKPTASSFQAFKLEPRENKRPKKPKLKIPEGFRVGLHGIK